MNFQKKMRGVRLAHRKSTERQSALRMPPPSLVTLPMSMHIGAPAKPIVKVGDPVFVGQKIAEASGFVSAAVFASVSGKVKKLDTMTDSLGRTIETVVIESDGLMTPLEGLSPREVNTPSELSDAARDAGLVGLGGAGFPTAVKLAAQPERVSHVVINGAECEPYITSDTRTMVEGADLLAEGAELLSRIYGADVIFGVEKNKPEAISALQKAICGNPRASVKVLPSIYPQGGEKVLVYNCIGRIIGEGKLPLDVGAIVVNCTTLYKLMEFIKTGMPLVEKTVTVDGSAIREPKNLTCPIGTPIGELIEFCGGFSREPRKILY
ncbi:MAG: RnfABCDGE type electron transport complex subunit C, partial [Clostridia bacterium]|nr:RnfABCDGE type electron transport complex subunit C [Clostridia bacterium]